MREKAPSTVAPSANDAAPNCARCREITDLDFAIAMAFQPIVDVSRQEVFAYEALVRLRGGENAAAEVLSRVNPEQLYRFDQTCRVVAIETAAALHVRERLSINFLPLAVYEPAACIRLTLDAAVRAGFSTERLIFEFTENERIDPVHTLNIVRYYRSRKMLTAFDDFGAGYAGLGLLVDFQPDLIKLDMYLIRGIETSAARQHIVAAVVGLCQKLAVRVVAEGVETAQELEVLADLGISLFQGYYVARPQLEALPSVNEAVWRAKRPRHK